MILAGAEDDASGEPEARSIATQESASISSSLIRPPRAAILSAVIVNYNSGTRLAECVRALHSTTQPGQISIVIVDNASHDDSLEKARTEFPGVPVVQSPANLGFGAAANLGASETHSRYLLVLSPDIVVQPKCIPRCISFMNRFTQVGIASCRLTDTSGRMIRICHELPNLRSTLAYAITALPARWRPVRNLLGRWMTRYHSGDYDRYVGYNTGAFILIRREVFEQTGGFDERFFLYAEDIDLYKRIQDMGYRGAFIADAAAVHHGGRSTRNLPDKDFIQLRRGRLQYLDKHLSRRAARIYRAVIRMRLSLRLMALSLRRETHDIRVAKRACRKVRGLL